MSLAALVSTLVVGVILLPGLVWLWISERRIPRTARPGALAVAEASGIGATATLITSFLLFALGSWLDWPFGFPEWISKPGSLRADLARNPVGIALVVLLEPMLASLGAGFLAHWIHRQKPVIAPGSTVLHETLGSDTGEKTKFVAITMKDGRIIEGWVGSYPTDPAERFLSVTAPVYVTDPGESESTEARSDEVIVSMDSVADIAVGASTENG